ncbi:MAG: helix-turn-helix domain-containing protein, partial [Blautia faecis]
RQGDEDAILEIFEMYRPLLIKSALVDGIFDEDLYQELTAELLKCIRYFRDVE